MLWVFILYFKHSDSFEIFLSIQGILAHILSLKRKRWSRNCYTFMNPETYYLAVAQNISMLARTSLGHVNFKYVNKSKKVCWCCFNSLFLFSLTFTGSVIRFFSMVLHITYCQWARIVYFRTAATLQNLKLVQAKRLTVFRHKQAGLVGLEYFGASRRAVYRLCVIVFVVVCLSEVKSVDQKCHKQVENLERVKHKMISQSLAVRDWLAGWLAG